jgi:type IV pilus assembly protein PilA
MLSTQKKGFTLIELLIVVVIIGILAAIAIPKFANTKEKAYVASMKADLRNLLTSQEAYISDNPTYGTFDNTASGPGQLGNGTLSTTFTPSAGVKVVVTPDGGTGWSARATHDAAPRVVCDIYVGSTAASPNRNEGEPICTTPQAQQ